MVYGLFFFDGHEGKGSLGVVALDNMRIRDDGAALEEDRKLLAEGADEALLGGQARLIQ